MTIKYYAQKYNVLSNPEQFTRAVHRYQLYLGDMKEGDYLCVNLEKHDKVQKFDSEPIMREHWYACHGIKADEILLPMVVPNLIREPAKPSRELGLGGRSGNPGPSGPPAGVTGAEGGVGQVTNPVQGPIAEGGIGQGTGPDQGAGPVQGQGAGPVHGQPRGRARGNISAEKKQELALLYSRRPTFRGEAINSKEKPAKENLDKVTPAKVTPVKGTPDVDPDSMDTGSTDKSDQPVVKHTGGKLKEYEANSNFGEGVDAELAKALDKFEKK